MAKRIILKGRVQGVACRYYCSSYGKSMGLRGSATNLSDGSVQVLLDTENDDAVRSYIDALRRNSLGLRFYGRIEDAEAQEYHGPFGGDYQF